MPTLVEQNLASSKRLSISERILLSFDALNAEKLQRENRILGGAEVSTGNTYVPASYQREVIKEAVSDLKILELVSGVMNLSATTTIDIPYEHRLTSPQAMPNQGIVYEGQGIPFSGASLRYEPAYIQPVKLALKVSNEVVHFTESSGVNWRAWSDNIAINARIVKELIQLRIAGEMQRAADAFNAVQHNETLTSNEEGLIKTTNFPVVRPLSIKDIQGREVGSTKNPLIVSVGGESIPKYTGETGLATGKYWLLENPNLGYVRIVNEKGEPSGGGLEVSLSYYYATNLIKFDLKKPSGVTLKQHYDDLLDLVGDVKARLNSNRYSNPDYILLSSVLANEITKADSFVASRKRNATELNSAGDVYTIKNTPVHETNSPTDLGDNRIILGATGLTSYAIAKPYTLSSVMQATDSIGQPTGELMAYGEEYSAIHTPSVVAGRYMSILAYDSSKR